MGRWNILILSLAAVGCTSATDIADVESDSDGGFDVESHTEALLEAITPFDVRLEGIGNNEAWFNNIRVNMDNSYNHTSGIAWFSIYNSYPWGQARIVADFHVDCDGEPDRMAHIDWILDPLEVQPAFTACHRINISSIVGTIDQ